MVAVSLITSGGGLGDLQDTLFTVDDANQYTFLVISAHEGQADSITSISIDGGSVSLSGIVNENDGTTSHDVYSMGSLSAGTHDLTIMTSGNTYRYGFVLLKVIGWDGVYTVSQTTGVGTTAALSLETRTPDTVLSFLTAETSVVATSADTLLQSQVAGTGLLRVRFATSYEQVGNISWTLASSQPWALSLIRLRGTAYYEIASSSLHNTSTPHTNKPVFRSVGRNILTPHP